MILLNSIFLSTIENGSLPAADKKHLKIPDALSFINFLRNSSDDNTSREILNTLSQLETDLPDNNSISEMKAYLQQLMLRESRHLPVEPAKEIINAEIINVNSLNTNNANRGLSLQTELNKNYFLSSEPITIDQNQLKELIEIAISTDILSEQTSKGENNNINNRIDKVLNRLKTEDKSLLIPLSSDSLKIAIKDENLSKQISNEMVGKPEPNSKEVNQSDNIKPVFADTKLSVSEKPDVIIPAKDESVFIVVSKEPFKEDKYSVNLLLSVEEITDLENIILPEKTVASETTPKQEKISIETKVAEENPGINYTVLKNTGEPVSINKNETIYTEEQKKDSNSSAGINSFAKNEAEEEIVSKYVRVKKHYFATTLVNTNTAEVETPKEVNNFENISVRREKTTTNEVHVETNRNVNPEVNVKETKQDLQSDDLKIVKQNNLTVKYEQGISQFISDYKPKQVEIVISYAVKSNNTDLKVNVSRENEVSGIKTKQVSDEVLLNSVKEKVAENPGIKNTLSKETIIIPEVKPELKKVVLTEASSDKNVSLREISQQPAQVKTEINSNEKPDNVSVKEPVTKSSETEKVTPEQIKNEPVQSPIKNIKPEFIAKEEIQKNTISSPVAKNNEAEIKLPSASKQNITAEQKTELPVKEKVNFDQIKNETVQQPVKIVKPESDIKEEPAKVILRVNIPEKPKQVEINFTNTSINRNVKNDGFVSARPASVQFNEEVNLSQPKADQKEIREQFKVDTNGSNEYKQKTYINVNTKVTETDPFSSLRNKQEEVRLANTNPVDKNNKQNIFQNYNPENRGASTQSAEKTNHTFIVNENAQESVKYIASFIHKPELKREIEQFYSPVEKKNILKTTASYHTAKTVYDELKSSLNQTATKENISASPKNVNEKNIVQAEQSSTVKNSQTVEEQDLNKTVQPKTEQPEANKIKQDKTPVAAENSTQKIKITEQVEWSSNETKTENIIAKEKLGIQFKPAAKEYIKQVKAAEIIKEISQFAQRKEDASLVLRITPVELGALKISIKMMNQLVKADIEVESEQVKSLVETNVNQLRETLQSNGVQLSSLTISLASYEQKNQKQFFAKKKQNTENSAGEVNEKKEKVEKKMGYNTYDYVV